MRIPKSVGLLIKITLFVVIVFVGYSQYTDADLFDQETITENYVTATTLDFANLNTANEQPQSLFFSVSGLLPTGFQVESVRIKNSGEMYFPFSITTQQTGGSTELCQNLQLKVLHNWQVVYTGSLLTLSLSKELTETQRYQDLVFAVSLDSNAASLKNQTCAFNFTVTSAKSGSHFHDTEVLQNTVTTGTWAQ